MQHSAMRVEVLLLIFLDVIDFQVSCLGSVGSRGAFTYARRNVVQLFTSDLTVKFNI